MAEQSLEKFDPSKMMDGVRDRIKATFVAMIPDEEWERMIQKEINDFFNKKTVDGYTTGKSTHFTGICFSILKEDAAKRVTEFLPDIIICELLEELERMRQPVTNIIPGRVYTYVDESAPYVPKETFGEYMDKTRYILPTDHPWNKPYGPGTAAKEDYERKEDECRN